MSFADVLLRVVPTASDEVDRLAVAVDLAQRLHARLDGIFVNERGASKADWARNLFERAIARSPLETSWRVVDGPSASALLFHARRSDLTVLPAGTSVPGAPSRAPELIALESGRPALILPPPSASMSIGHRVLVGWNETRESCRAIHDAMPILMNADKVFVLTVMADDDLEPLADRRLAEHLLQHGVSAELERRHGDAAEEIAAEARRLDVDLVVVGLHGSAEARPALGEVSRRFLRTMSVPVFCSH
jgi:nucleotide-binding universal stress UspA family protein